MSTVASRHKILPSHEDRQALIARPLPFDPRRTFDTFHEHTVYAVKRWGGVQIVNDEDWMRDANAWRKKYEDSLTTIDWEAQV